MKSERDSHADSENSNYNFGFKIELDDGKRVSSQQQGFDDFGFGDYRNFERKEREKTSSPISHQKSKSDISAKEPPQPNPLTLSQRPENREPSNVNKIDAKERTNISPVKQKVPQLISFTSKQIHDPTQDLEKIKYYKKQSQILEYESSKLREKHIELLRANERIDNRLEESSVEIIEYNNRISESLAYEESSQRILQITQAEKISLIKQFSIPLEAIDPLNEEQELLLRELGDIEKEFKQLIESHNNLQLSRTEQYQIKATNKEESIYNDLLNKLNNLSKDPSITLRNIKMSSLKSRWILFENNSVQIGITYDTSSNESVVAHIHIGNKSNTTLQTIELKYQSGEELFVGKSVKPNSFLETYKTVYNPMFDHLDLGFSINSATSNEYIVLPFNWTKFGDFQIVTYQHFTKVWKSRSGEIESEKYYLDTDIVSKLEDYVKYFPNLISSYQGFNQLLGVFSIERGEFRGTKLYCKIIDYGDTHAISVAKTPNTDEVRESFLADLHFIFSI